MLHPSFSSSLLVVLVSLVSVAFAPLPLTVAAGVEPSPATVAGAGEPTPSLDWEVVSRRPHDRRAFTQGLVFDTGGHLYESTGKYGRSQLRELDPSDGSVVRSVQLADPHFGEGLAAVGDRLLQLTWKRGVAISWEADTFGPLETFAYDGDGWGLCYDGTRLVMSDGSDQLIFRDPDTFEIIGSVAVTEAGQPLTRLNELECVGGAVWANVWHTDRIVRIDPELGVVDGVLDLSGILEPHPARKNSTSVLNGIAYDETSDTFLVTGKRWPEMIEIRVHEGGRGRSGPPA